MKREDYSPSNWTTQRIKKRMHRGILEENLLIAGLVRSKPRRHGHQAFLVKGAVLFLAIFSFSVIRNSDFGDYHSLPALPLSRTMALPADRPANAPLAANGEAVGNGFAEYQPFLSQSAFSLRTIFGLKVKNIVIDPGHGGEDPGTLGRSGTREKDITLDIARRLQQRLGRYDGYRISLTREIDETLSLESRIDFANSHHADLFVSIHVNNIPNKPYGIIETYYFGPNADRGTLALAEKENSGAGYAMNDFRALVQKIGNTLKYQEAKTLARTIQKSLYGNMHRRNVNLYDYGVKTAPFIVLLGVDVPSVLTEVTCLSEPEEEQKLNSEDYREDIARYIEEGIIQYLQIKSNPIKSEV